MENNYYELSNNEEQKIMKRYTDIGAHLIKFLASKNLIKQIILIIFRLFTIFIFSLQFHFIHNIHALNLYLILLISLRFNIFFY